MQLLVRRFPRLRRPLPLGEAFRLSKLFRDKPGLVQKQWRQLGLEGADAKAELAAYHRFLDETVRPFRNACLAAVYGAALRAFREAGDIYDRLRRESNVLNFQDLLMATAAMLRDFPEVRGDLAGRYARLLVDEVQDTDPIQAEILFLLASSDMRQRDWRLCPPRPGALFIVGDPKQSIYRFRRADIVVYQEVKRLIAAGGGKTLGLNANFRSQPEILDWVNHTFCHGADDGLSPEAAAGSGRFTGTESPYSPGYVPLEPGRAAAGDGAFHGVYYLETIPLTRKEGVTEQAIVRDEAARIAAFIRHAVDTATPLPDGKGVRPADPGDFLIVTYQKAAAGAYADAVRRMGLECVVSSGGVLGESAALNLLREYLAALSEPCDPVRLLAVLRGGLFGISDRQLFAWKKAGGRFDFLAPLPGSASPLADVFAMMNRHRRRSMRIGPIPAAREIVDDLGLWPYSCLGDDPATTAGVLATTLELLRNEHERIPTLGKLVERLEWLMENHERDPLPARMWPGRAVRVMNVHKTKGLEAPVVFLASTRTVRGHGVDFAVRRRGGMAAAAMAICGGEFGGTVFARPADWETMAEEEALFHAAERTRLNYVAATRAGAALVVSVHQTGGVWKSAFLPEFRPGVTIEKKLPEPEEQPRMSDRDIMEAVVPRELDVPLRLREAEQGTLRGESYLAERAKPEGEAAAAMWGGSPDGGEEAMALGEVLHRLLEAREDETDGMAEKLLRDFSLPRGMLNEVLRITRGVRKSELWNRAMKAERVFRETPFTLPVTRDGIRGLRRGVIDLAFREAKGWIIVDYKSDRLPEGSDPGQAARRHAGQLTAYAEAWESITGERVAETGIYFLRTGEYATVSV